MAAHFSYGLDLGAMVGELPVAGEQLAAERTRFLDTILRMQGAVTSVAACRKPVIAAISGWCIGGGLDLIAACDIRLCSAEARFSLRETKMAIVADIGSLQRLPHIIGEGNTRELALTGKDIDAERAQRMGLVNEVYESPEALLAGARAMAGEIAANAPLVVQGTKRVLNERIARDVEDGLRFVAVWNAAFLQSLDLQEAIAAFFERRPPRFEGQLSQGHEIAMGHCERRLGRIIVRGRRDLRPLAGTGHRERDAASADDRAAGQSRRAERSWARTQAASAM